MFCCVFGRRRSRSILLFTSSRFLSWSVFICLGNWKALLLTSLTPVSCLISCHLWDLKEPCRCGWLFWKIRKLLFAKKKSRSFSSMQPWCNRFFSLIEELWGTVHQRTQSLDTSSTSWSMQYAIFLDNLVLYIILHLHSVRQTLFFLFFFFSFSQLPCDLDGPQCCHPIGPTVCPSKKKKISLASYLCVGQVDVTVKLFHECKLADVLLPRQGF